MRVCFYAAVRDPELFDIVEFYRQDIAALRCLGHDVKLARAPGAIGTDWDLAWAWWPTSGAPPILAARALGRPAVLVSAHSENDRSASGWTAKSPQVRLMRRLALSAASLVLATSEDTRLGLVRYARHLRMVPLGIDTDVYGPAPAPPAPQSERPLVLTISHLTMDNVLRKRILDVVRAAAFVPEARFVIAGGHESGSEAVRAEIDRLGLGDRVELHGRVSREEKIRLLQAASAYFQPTEYEAFGVSIAEAMACTVPVVTSSVGAVPSLVGETATLTPSDASPEELANALLGVLRERPDGSAGRRRIVDRYSADHRRAAVEEVLDAVSSRSGQQHAKAAR